MSVTTVLPRPLWLLDDNRASKVDQVLLRSPPVSSNLDTRYGSMIPGSTIPSPVRTRGATRRLEVVRSMPEPPLERVAPAGVRVPSDPRAYARVLNLVNPRVRCAVRV